MAPPPPLSRHLPRTSGGGFGAAQKFSFSAVVGEAIKRQPSIFPPAREMLENSAILASPVATGEVARHRRDDRGARGAVHDLCDKEVQPLMAPPPPLSRHLPRSGGGGFGVRRCRIPKANPSGTSEDKRTFCPLRISSFKRSAFRNSQVFRQISARSLVKRGVCVGILTHNV